MNCKQGQTRDSIVTWYGDLPCRCKAREGDVVDATHLGGDTAARAASLSVLDVGRGER